MSKLIRSHQPCPDCGSSDALAVYDDGTHCFSCGATKKTTDGDLDDLAMDVPPTPQEPAVEPPKSQ